MSGYFLHSNPDSLLIGMMAVAGSAHAITKCVGADGKVTYTEGLCPIGTNGAAAVPGTENPERVQREAARMRNVERDELDIQRDRAYTDRVKVDQQRARDQLARERDRDRLQNSEQCLAAQETLQHRDTYANRNAMKIACGR